MWRKKGTDSCSIRPADQHNPRGRSLAVLPWQRAWQRWWRGWRSLSQSPVTFLDDATRLMRSSNTSKKKKKEKKENGCPRKTCFTPAPGAECACQCSRADAKQDARANLCHDKRGEILGLKDEFGFVCWLAFQQRWFYFQWTQCSLST